MKWTGQLVYSKKLKFGNPVQPPLPPKKCLILNKFLLNVQDFSMRFIGS
jgi:hypothetical protein